MEERIKPEKIELELKKKIDKDYDDCASLICRILEDEEYIHKLAVLKSCLEKVGIILEATRYEATDIITFKIDYGIFDKVANKKIKK